MNEQPRVLLCQLSVRKSQRTGKSYMTGWLGKSRLIAFQSAEPDRWGNVCFDVYVQAVEARPMRTCGLRCTRAACWEHLTRSPCAPQAVTAPQLHRAVRGVHGHLPTWHHHCGVRAHHQPREQCRARLNRGMGPRSLGRAGSISPPPSNFFRSEMGFRRKMPGHCRCSGNGREGMTEQCQ